MTLGLADRQTDLFDDAKRFCDEAVPADSIYALLHRERDRLFPDEMFEDLFTTRGRRSIPPSIVATVMVFQRLEGCSDREAVDRFTFDLRWKYAAGVDETYPGFVHTVLVDMRARLRGSDDPDRVFDVTTDVARDAGLIGVRRVLDSAPLYDAVATQDTVTLIRSAIRGLLKAADDDLERELRKALTRDDDYRSAGKPVCDWDDPEARAALVDELVNDALDVLEALEGTSLGPGVREAAELLATVVGQDVDHGPDDLFRIARRTAKDRVISTVDTDARHGHKSSSKGFDGYKGHIAIDPDSEIITAASVGTANEGDGDSMPELLGELEEQQERAAADDEQDPQPSRDGDGNSKPVVYGDSAYGSGEGLARLEDMGAVPMTKVQMPTAPEGHFTKDCFNIDLEAQTVTCPNDVTVSLAPTSSGAKARFGAACASCPLRPECTTSPTGRVVTVTPHEALLTAARERQKDPAWQQDYRAHRPKVERKLAHMLRRRHGGRRARVRGRPRVDQDWKLLAAAVNLARLAVLGVAFADGSPVAGDPRSLVLQRLRMLARWVRSESRGRLRAIGLLAQRSHAVVARIAYSAPAT
ncbi:MAG TPA: IS1182 family transposase [Actinomycetota bacterium]|nr:IS1182 family transposase [Actinomycetota bacterium]